MTFDVRQVLQDGIAAHKGGNIQEAERLYRSILGEYPKHPDANHNMGVLAVGVGKVEAALPFFKAAIEANRTVEQFWLSYINALLKLQRIEEAKALIVQAKDAKLKDETLAQLYKALNSTKNSQLSLQQATEKLFSLYSQGEFEEALKLGEHLTSQFPNTPNVSNILGAINHSLGKFEAALSNFLPVPFSRSV